MIAVQERAEWTTTEPFPLCLTSGDVGTQTLSHDLVAEYSRRLREACRVHVRRFETGRALVTSRTPTMRDLVWIRTGQVVCALTGAASDTEQTREAARPASNRSRDAVSGELVEGIDEICIGARLTREKLGELLGVKRRTVHSWISGNRVPGPATLARIARLRTALGPVLEWRGADVQEWLHSGNPSGFELLRREDYSAFEERIGAVGWRRRSIEVNVERVESQSRAQLSEEEPAQVALPSPSELASDWLTSVKQRSRTPRRASHWYPEVYEAIPDTED